MKKTRSGGVSCLCVVLILLVCVTITGCADTVTFAQAASIDAVGFWHGLWHGITFPVSFIGSIFADSISVYAIYNNGGWYDFGFFLGVGGFAASAAST